MGAEILNGADHRRLTAPAVLVGRGAETATLRALVNRCGDAPAVVAVVGDPGIGKSRLLAELIAQAGRGGRTVLVGAAAEFEQEVPFGVLRNALDDHLRGLSAGSRAGLDGAALRLLPSVFPALVVDDGDGDRELGPPAGERYRLHRAVRVLLEHIAGRAGLVLALDDLHWADESSIELLDHLLRHPPRAPLLLALAYRPRQASARLVHALAGAVQRGLATVLNVGPLSAADAVELLPAALHPTQRQELYQASGGNPFYLEVLARSGQLGGSVSDPDAVGSMPAPVRAALANDFTTLDPHRQRVVHAAAVAGDGFTAGLLAAIAELGEPEVLAALDELVERDLVRLTGVPGGFRFRHPLLRSAAYQHAGAGWRLAAHARAAAELSRRGAPVEVRAGHIQASAAVGDLAAVEVLRAAAVDAMHATPATAGQWLGSALRLLPQDPACAGLRLQLLSMRASAVAATGRLGESRDILGEALRLLPGPSEQRAAVVTFLTVIEHLLGNHAQARALLAQELADLPDQQSSAAGALRAGLALTSVMYGPPDPAAVVEAIRLARGTGDRPTLAAALGVGVIANHSFDVTDPQTTDWLDEAVQLVDAMPDHELTVRLDTVLFVGWGELYLERFGAARRHLERALQLARSSGQNNIIGTLQTLLGALGGSTGELSWALAHLDDAVESAVLIGEPQSQARALSLKCWISIWQGDPEEALTFGEEAVALAAGGDSPGWQVGPAEGMLGLAHYAAGDPQGALEMMVRAGRDSEPGAIRPVWQARWYEGLAAVAAAAGDERGAAEWAARAGALPVVESLPRRTGLIHLAHVHATLPVDPAAAAVHAGLAAESFERCGDRLGAARAHLYAGVAYRDLGSAAAAEREIATARRDFAACGAAPQWLARLTGVPLTDLPPTEVPVTGVSLSGVTEGVRRATAAVGGGGGPAAADPDTPDPSAGYRLTARELSVLRLLAESLTAGAIARRLGISQGTVHKHLARLYRKLGTGDRLATVLRARETGLLRETAD